MRWSMEPHRWTKMKGVGRDRCIKCGLMALHNKFSEWCVKMGCDHADHAMYNSQRENCANN